MGVPMAKDEPPPVSSCDHCFAAKPDHSAPAISTADPYDPNFLPYWARYSAQYAQNLLDCSDEPIEYDPEDADYHDNAFFFPEDCSWTPPKDWVVEAHRTQVPQRRAVEQPISLSAGPDTNTTDAMIPGLPDIKMLDSEALGDLLDDNLSPPEITTILYVARELSCPRYSLSDSLMLISLLSVFATNGAVFAYASSLSSRQLRNLSATYGAAYTCYAKTASTGNLTGVNPASHPSSYVTAQSMSLGDVGSIVFELDDSVAVVTRLADKVLLAAVGPSKVDPPSTNGAFDSNRLSVPDGGYQFTDSNGTPDGSHDGQRTPTAAPASPNATARNGTATDSGAIEIDRSADLERLASLNLSASPAVLLALESKCAALGRFLGQKLSDLESPDDF
ncbi:hypothetical protein N7474_002826 [Penicillium riverlandense]|uniref:uncharacterized protein n=1 Tax=Penicillium riverlandense TaxID=1903569 RepID=UPI002548D64F|nr:uncharacterized protein N7474_002826 [Penicillium riverlandense]KAJ5825688.1 hypothetical protein N7474_002826 [Penicillium riverlandense]